MTVPQKVGRDFSEWFYESCHSGIFCLYKHSGSSRTAAGISNVVVSTFLIPWFLCHRVAFHNHNAHPLELKNRIGWMLFGVLSLLIDTVLVLAGIFIFLVGNHANNGELGIYSLFGLLCLVGFSYLGIHRIPNLYKKMPIPIETPDTENEVEETQEEVDEEEEEEIEELYFCQLIRLNSTTDLHIIKVEYCPDETAFIRIVTDESFTQPYKRKVMRDKRGERYINFNNEKYYLDPKKTQARMPE